MNQNREGVIERTQSVAEHKEKRRLQGICGSRRHRNSPGVIYSNVCSTGFQDSFRVHGAYITDRRPSTRQ